jgi:hypothetical protein
MKRLFSMFVAAGLIFAVGCGGGTKPPADNKDGSSTPKDGDSKKAPAAKLEALDTKGAGSVEGKVLFDGTPPAAKPIDMSKDETGHCKKSPDGEKVDQTWVVDANGGVANVIVWVQAPKGKFFKLSDKDKAKKDDVVIKQPFCAFEPHAFAIFPTFFDEASKKQVSTGAKLSVANDAPIPHNSNVEFASPKLQSTKNEMLPPKSGDAQPKALTIADIKTSKDTEAGSVESIKVTCNIHPWMKAFGKAFDHPFFAVTKDGTYKIENVPAGTELDVMYWHESMAEPKSAGKIKIVEGQATKVPDTKIK